MRCAPIESRRHAYTLLRLREEASDGVEASGFGLAACKTLAQAGNLGCDPKAASAATAKACHCLQHIAFDYSSTTLTLARSLITPSASNQT